ncbi:MAG: hypothetical protein AB7V32_04905, partial [Candidatus Berkiella sp.]
MPLNELQAKIQRLEAKIPQARQEVSAIQTSVSNILVEITEISQKQNSLEMEMLEFILQLPAGLATDLDYLNPEQEAKYESIMDQMNLNDAIASNLSDQMEKYSDLFKTKSKRVINLFEKWEDCKTKFSDESLVKTNKDLKAALAAFDAINVPQNEIAQSQQIDDLIVNEHPVLLVKHKKIGHREIESLKLDAKWQPTNQKRR